MISCYKKLGIVCSKLSKTPDAITYFQKGIDLLSAMDKRDVGALISLYDYLAPLYLKRWVFNNNDDSLENYLRKQSCAVVYH